MSDTIKINSGFLGYKDRMEKIADKMVEIYKDFTQSKDMLLDEENHYAGKASGELQATVQVIEQRLALIANNYKIAASYMEQYYDTLQEADKTIAKKISRGKR